MRVTLPDNAGRHEIVIIVFISMVLRSVSSNFDGKEKEMLRKFTGYCSIPESVCRIESEGDE